MIPQGTSLAYSLLIASEKTLSLVRSKVEVFTPALPLRVRVQNHCMSIKSDWRVDHDDDAPTDARSLTRSHIYIYTSRSSGSELGHVSRC